MDKKLRSDLFKIIEPAIFNNTNNYYLDKALEALKQLISEERQKVHDLYPDKEEYLAKPIVDKLISEAEIKAKIEELETLDVIDFEPDSEEPVRAMTLEEYIKDRITALKQGKGE